MRHHRAFVSTGIATLILALTTASLATAQTTIAASDNRPELPATSDSSAVTDFSSLPGLSDLVTGTFTDFRHLPSRDTAAWLSLGAAMALIGHAQDAQVTHAMTGTNRLEETFESGSTIGGVPFQFGGALAAYTVGRVIKSPTLTGVAVDLIHAQAMAQILTQAVKVSANRVRPDGTSYSFPSGHTSTSFATATVLQRHFGWKAGIPAYAMASYVAASRIEARRHFLSDVVFGAALGIVAGRTVTIGHGDARFALTPIAAPDNAGTGAGLGLTWVGSR